MNLFATTLVSLLGLALCATLSTARSEGWVSIGPFGLEIANHDVINGQANTLAVDPRDANIIFSARLKAAYGRHATVAHHGYPSPTRNSFAPSLADRSRERCPSARSPLIPASR